MVTPHTFFLIELVAQTLFALIFALLAWCDRRTRGLMWLAGASILQVVECVLQANMQEPAFWIATAIAACFAILPAYFVYMGLRCFVTRRRLRSLVYPAVVSGWMLLAVAVAPLSGLWSLELARLGALVILGFTVEMLWNTRVAALRSAAHATALLILGLMAVLVFRLPLEAHAVVTPMMILARQVSAVAVTLMGFAFITMFVAESNRRLHDETRLDMLTGLRNRRAMEEMAAQQVRMAQRTGRPLALLMMDLDYFKNLNDTWGHSLGDRALRAVGGVLLTVTGGDDMVARMGGEEFAVLLPGRTVEMAQAVAERLRATVADLRLSEGDRLASFTVSIGVGALHAGETAWTEMLRRADVALYRAKREGRNRVVLCAEATKAADRAAVGQGGAWRRWDKSNTLPPRVPPSSERSRSHAATR